MLKLRETGKNKFVLDVQRPEFALIISSEDLGEIAQKDFECYQW